MFRLVRYFSLSSAVAIAVLTAGLIYGYQRVAQRDLIQTVETYNITLTRSFANAIWDEFGGYLTSTTETNPDALRATPETAALHQALSEIAAGTPVLKLKFFNLAGVTLYSSEFSQIGDSKWGNPGFMQAIGQGVSTSGFSERDSFNSFSGEMFDVAIVESYVPLKNDQGEVIGVFELYNDVSGSVQNIQRNTFLAAGALTFAFLGLYLTLFLTIRRANGILQTQYAQLQEARTDADFAAREAKAAAVDARSANRAKSEFLAVMSHEIRTPLNGIIGMTSLLLEDKMPDDQRELLKVVKDSGDGLLAIVNDILDIAKIEAGRFELHAEPFDIFDAVESVVELMNGRAQQKNVEIACQIDPDLPRVVVGDAVRIRQVLLNLVGNAVKFTDQGGVEVDLLFDGLRSGSAHMRIVVRDTGIGIEEKFLETLFQPFSQADSSSTRNFEGTGLGLAICRDLLALMGGSIQVDSVVNEGSEFMITLALPIADPAELATPRRGPGCVRGKHILIVDDFEVNRSVLEYYVDAEGGTATGVHSGARALEALAREDFDVVIIDQMMPRMDGLELLDRIKAMGLENQPLTVLSSSAGDIHTNKAAIEHGFDAAMPKPIRLSAFRATMAFLASNLAKAEPAPAPVAAATTKADGPSRILVAEDNPYNQKLIRTLLNRRGYLVDMAEDGEVAVDLWRRGDYALILMDLRMPRMDGFAAARAIREAEGPSSRIPIFALSASVLEEDRRAATEAGMDDFVTKPIDVDSLTAMVKSWVDAQDEDHPFAATAIG